MLIYDCSIGDKVICIDPSGTPSLTLYKQYIATYVDYGSSHIAIINDDNDELGYWMRRFILLKDFRKQKIKKLCLEWVIE